VDIVCWLMRCWYCSVVVAVESRDETEDSVFASIEEEEEEEEKEEDSMTVGDDDACGSVSFVIIRLSCCKNCLLAVSVDCEFVLLGREDSESGGGGSFAEVRV
jgi:hypothetical protein